MKTLIFKSQLWLAALLTGIDAALTRLHHPGTLVLGNLGPSSGATIRADINIKVEEAQSADDFFIGTKAMPPLSVDAKSGTYPKIQIAAGELLSAGSTERTADGSYGEAVRQWTSDNYECVDRGLEERVDDTVSQDLARFFNVEVATARWLLRNVTLSHEIRAAAALVNATTFGAGTNSGGADFTSVGAANNNVDTTFTATDVTPTWGPGGQLRSPSIQPADTVLRLTLTDGATGPDAYLAGRTAGTPIEAAQDVLLAVIANVSSGKIVVTDGLPQLEFCSIIAREAVNSDTHNYTVIRGRRDIPERDWDPSAQVWIIPGASLIAWQHPEVAGLVESGGTGYVELSAFTAYAEDETPWPQFECDFPESYFVGPRVTWTTPTDNPAILATDGTITPDADITDADGNLIRVQLFCIDAAGEVELCLDVPLTPTNEITLQECFTAAGISGTLDLGTQTGTDQNFTLTIRTTDSAGNATDSSVTVILEGSVASLGGVAFHRQNPTFFSKYIIRHSLTSVAATEIHMAALAPGSAAPTGYTIRSGELFYFYFGNTRKRLWARASDGTNHSEWQYFDL